MHCMNFKRVNNKSLFLAERETENQKYICKYSENNNSQEIVEHLILRIYLRVQQEYREANDPLYGIECAEGVGLGIEIEAQYASQNRTGETILYPLE